MKWSKRACERDGEDGRRSLLSGVQDGRTDSSAQRQLSECVPCLSMTAACAFQRPLGGSRAFRGSERRARGKAVRGGSIVDRPFA